MAIGVGTGCAQPSSYLSELGVFLGVVGGIMTSVLLTIQKSKCKNHIKCCGCECDRDPTLPSTDGVESTQP